MAKKLPKKPKQPKMSASKSVWDNWNRRMVEWEKRVKEIKKPAIEKMKIRDRWRGKSAGNIK